MSSEKLNQHAQLKDDTKNFLGSYTLALQRMYGEIIFKPLRIKIFVTAKATVDFVLVVLT